MGQLVSLREQVVQQVLWRQGRKAMLRRLSMQMEQCTPLGVPAWKIFLVSGWEIGSEVKVSSIVGAGTGMGGVREGQKVPTTTAIHMTTNEQGTAMEAMTGVETPVLHTMSWASGE
eukprot:TRINITY_DN5157_c0_g3_i1.p2 TRINITY_DN5157_c0_g3~~TRINITY_DN5157_c0_g3_i1.p2  ORF type:complete len:116 (-),score=18.32 TRINITY_DN5157_c0_g3_i1:5-352(-)